MRMNGLDDRLGRLLLILVAAMALPLQLASAFGAVPVSEALDEAFRFASALTVDPEDMARAQEQVSRASAAAGDLAGAARLTSAIDGWRRAAVTADLASLHAARGEKERALELVAQAEALQQTTSGWPHLRVAMHVAEARARLGELEAARRVAGEAAAADPRQYTGRGAGIVAVAHATLGDTDSALKLLAPLDADGDIDIAFWRTWGYIETARLAQGTDRDRAFDAAERSTAGVPDSRRIESLEALSGALSERGMEERARSVAGQAGKLVSALPASIPIKGRLLTAVARRQSALGMPGEARELLRHALEEAPVTIAIDRPVIYGEVAASYAALNDRESAGKTLVRALEAAATLENARPRALAVAEICAAAGRNGIPLEPQVRERLERLYQGLKAPW